MDKKFTLLTQFTIPVVNTPGQLGSIVKLLRQDNINLVGITAEVIGNTSFVRLITPETPEKVAALFTKNSYAVIQSPVVSVTLNNKPGELERLSTFLVEQGLNINGIYGTTPTGATTATLIVSLDTTGKTINYEDVFGKFYNSVPVGA